MADIKASYNNKRLVLGRQLPLDTPMSVILDTSERCNFKCTYCFRSQDIDKSWDYAAKNQVMSMDIFEAAVKQLTEFPRKIKVISLSGHGEPLLNPGIVHMASYLKGSIGDVHIEMHTNASLLTEKNAEAIAKSGFSRIVVSLQGLDSAAYERVSGVKLDWELFYHNLKLLYEGKGHALKIHIKISEAGLDKNNYHSDEKRFYSLFGGIADSVFIEKVTPLWKNLKLDADKSTNKFGQNHGRINYCPILFYKIWVAPDGELYPCTGLPSPMSLGNINTTTLLEAWNGSRRLEFLKEHLLFSCQGNPFCRDCFVPINTVTSEKDRIDPYQGQILRRLEEQIQ